MKREGKPDSEPKPHHCAECGDPGSYTTDRVECDGTAKYCMCHEAVERVQPEDTIEYWQNRSAELLVEVAQLTEQRDLWIARAAEWQHKAGVQPSQGKQVPMADRAEKCAEEIWKHIPEQYKKERWGVDYDEKLSTFFVHSGGYRIADAEDSEVAHAICAAYNIRSHYPDDRELLEALVAARDVIVSLQKSLAWIPSQQGYSTKMTDAELQASRAVTDLDTIIGRTAIERRG